MVTEFEVGVRTERRAQRGSESKNKTCVNEGKRRALNPRASIEEGRGEEGGGPASCHLARQGRIQPRHRGCISEVEGGSLFLLQPAFVALFC
mmetsp:Transcript_24317/g.47740  ORF Transcript_24317/g.47740 Transcript_24317/m.47740 type:complete len:92 (+) Transcript_24317:321-596(+)